MVAPLQSIQQTVARLLLFFFFLKNSLDHTTLLLKHYIDSYFTTYKIQVSYNDLSQKDVVYFN